MTILHTFTRGVRRGGWAVTFTLGLALAGCGGGGGGGSAPQPQPQPQPQPEPQPQPQPEPEQRGRLVAPESSAAFADYIRAGLLQWASTPDNGAGNTAGLAPLVRALIATPEPALRLTDQAVTDADAAPISAPEAAVGDAALSLDGIEFSTTNTVVTGVDERDRIKYDGETLYAMGWGRVDAYRMSADAPGERLGGLSLAGLGVDYGDGLYYLPEDNGEPPMLVAVGGEAAYQWVDLMVDPWYWSETTRVALINVADPSAMSVADGFTVSGTLTHSRRIGDRLLLVTRHTPDPEGLLPHTTDGEDQQTNEALIESLDVNDVLPTITLGDGTTEPLVSAENCLLPANIDVEDAVYLPTITTISWIDLRDPGERASLCMAEGIQGAHVSTDAVYLSAFDWRDTGSGFYNRTVIHKISLTAEGPGYTGSASVPGSFWGNPAFLMGEAGGALAVVTTTPTSDPDDPFTHHLTTLGDGEDFELMQLGQIPSEAAPAKIGKPREQIFASRIAGERAYIVTFEQVDPVYVIDLADASNPTILGELTIPGFSDYLHPLDDDRVIGVGRNADGETGPLRLLGVNVRLFDVSDPTAPSMLSDIAIGSRGSRTPVDFDYQAFTLLQTGADSWRMALPVTVHGDATQEVPDEFWWISPWVSTGLHLFDVTSAGIEPAGQVVAQDQTTGRRWQAGCCAWGQRSVLHGDVVHYIADHQLITSDWEDPGARRVTALNTTRDVPGDVCTEEARPGIEVYVASRATGEPVICPTIIARDGDYAEQMSGDVCFGQSWAQGAFERAGDYLLEISADGFEPRALENVIVTADRCHVRSVYVEAWLDTADEGADG